MIGMLTKLRMCRKFAYQVLVCLRFLKRQKVLHCDLKPENILLKESGRSGIKVPTFSLLPSPLLTVMSRLHQSCSHGVYKSTASLIMTNTAAMVQHGLAVELSCAS